jgi:hypothetical protein
MTSQILRRYWSREQQERLRPRVLVYLMVASAANQMQAALRAAMFNDYADVYGFQNPPWPNLISYRTFPESDAVAEYSEGVCPVAPVSCRKRWSAHGAREMADTVRTNASVGRDGGRGVGASILLISSVFGEPKRSRWLRLEGFLLNLRPGQVPTHP